MRKRLLLGILVFIMAPMLLLAQPIVPPAGGPDPGDPGDRIPITESILMLVAGGVGLGIKHFSKKKK